MNIKLVQEKKERYFYWHEEAIEGQAQSEDDGAGV